MSNGRRLSRELHAATRGGVVLGNGHLLGASSHARYVRNADGQPIMCNHGPCYGKPGDHRFRIESPHDDGIRNLVHIFCSETCRRGFAEGTRYERYL